MIIISPHYYEMSSSSSLYISSSTEVISKMCYIKYKIKRFEKQYSPFSYYIKLIK